MNSAISHHCKGILLMHFTCMHFRFYTICMCICVFICLCMNMSEFIVASDLSYERKTCYICAYAWASNICFLQMLWKKSWPYASYVVANSLSFLQNGDIRITFLQVCVLCHRPWIWGIQCCTGGLLISITSILEELWFLVFGSSCP